ncbi:hypothetical protein HZB60_10450 [candidate division KSB1 bacterium]|nr:hypothetical protein [candidate division KSB1 bacterium]
MFFTLLAVTFAASFITCVVVARVFRKSVNEILHRLVGEEIYKAWTRYLGFAIFVTGLSGGVRVWDFERYVFPQGENSTILELTAERWSLELYRTIIGTLQAVAWMLLVFFVFALIAYVIVKGRELKRGGGVS